MADGSLEKIWDGTNIEDQKEVNKALKDSMTIISPAVEKVWQLNIKVNVLYAIIGFSAFIIMAILAYFQINGV